jgi:hypothetical protein
MPPVVEVPRSLRVVADGGEFAARLESFAATLAAEQAGASDGGLSVSVREVSGSYRLALETRDGSRAPFVLTLHAGNDWAAGNALLLDASDGRSVVVWRGGLLGAARARQDLLWSEARLQAVLIEDAPLGLAQRGGLVAHTGADLMPQLRAFADEIARLGDVFDIEPPPALGHALTDFSELPAKKQSLFLYKALLGLGSLELGDAARIAA